MNKAYKSIYNYVTQSWVAVSEATHAKGKKSSGALMVSGLLALTSLVGVSTAVSAATEIHYYSVYDKGVVNGNYNNDGATGTNAIAIGINSVASKSEAYALGSNSLAAGDNSMAVGASAQVNSSFGVAIGSHAQANAIGVVAIGAEAGENSSGNIWSVAIGNLAGANTTGSGNMSIGRFAGSNSTGNSNVAISGFAGQYVNGSNNQAIGQNAGQYVTGSGNIAFGSSAGKGTDTAALVVNNTVAIGTSALASKNTAIAIGNGAQAAGTGSISIGVGNKVSGNNSGAFGNYNVIAQGNTFVLGNSVTTTQANSVVLGNASTDRAAVEVDGATIPGVIATLNPDGTVTYTQGKNITYTGFAGTATGVVSVGAAGAERQIINVAAGTITATSTDAINGSQLYAIASQVSALGGSITNIVNNAQTHFYSVNGTTADANYDNSGATGTNSMAVGVGASATQANASAIGYNAVASATNATAVGQGAQAAATDSTAVGSGAKVAATAFSGIAIGKDASANVAGGVAIGEGSVSSTAGGVAGYVPPPANAAQTSAIVATTSTTGSFAVGSASNGVYRQITGLAAGTADSDAVNVAQLKAVQGSITDAVDVAKTRYYSVNDGGIQGANYNNDGATGTNSMASGVGATSAGSAATATGYNASASGTNSVALGSNSQATASNAMALGSDAKASEVGAVALGSGSQTAAVVATSGAVIAGTSYQFAGTAPTSTVSVGSSGNERTVTNVAAGRVSASSTDAINGSQLFATNQAVEAVGNRVTTVESNIVSLQSDMRKAYGGVAAALSLEAAPYIPGTTTFAIGTGYFQKESAFGVSLRRTADNGRWSLSGGATISRGGVGARLAVTGILYDER